jgi:predicted RNA binding protein YcfA (HicA-like mRNA interferase family)
VAKLTSVSWFNLVRKLRYFGFEGPYQGGKHPYMTKGNFVLTLPNPHRKEIGTDLLARILKQATIDKDKWTKAD